MFVLRFPVSRIEEGENRVSIEVLPSDLELEYDDVVFKEPIKVESIFSRFCSGIMVKVSVETEVEIICSRCLKPFDYLEKLSFEVQVMLRHGGPHFAEFMDEDYASLDIGSGLIDLRERVREEIILDLPMMPLCSEDCPGIVIDGGKKGEIDRRWSKLKDFNRS